MRALRRAMLATFAAYGLATLILSAYPDAWGWARPVLAVALVIPMNLVARSLECEE